MAAHKNNKYAIGNNGGRPAKYETAADLNSRACFYFNHCDQYGQHYTVSGLALYLGFCDTKALKYQKRRGEEFAYIIDRAYMVISVEYEKMLRTKNWRAAIWVLRNMGWCKEVGVDGKEAMTHEEVKELTKHRTPQEEKEYFEKELLKTNKAA